MSMSAKIETQRDYEKIELQRGYQRRLQRQDYFPKVFLTPSEIKLHPEHGLVVVRRDSQNPDKFEEEEIQPITLEALSSQHSRRFSRKQLQAKPQEANSASHGLLSLFKSTQKRRIKLAICVCVYSQPKHMLKQTIKGIQDSYRSFMDKAGILPHEIIIVAIFDGIEKVNNSTDHTENMISYFNKYDIKNGFREKKYGWDFTRKNVRSNLSVFTEQELADLQPTLFQNQYNQFLRKKHLLQEIQALKKLKLLKTTDLPPQAYTTYEQLCLQFCKKSEIPLEEQERIQELLVLRPSTRLKLIFDALYETEAQAKRYIESRLDHSILYPVRLEGPEYKSARVDLNENSVSMLTADAPAQKSENYMFLCVKHKNEGKLSSHFLFFEGFCKLFDPQFCILTDIGVKPHKDAIFKMWQHMQKNPRCGGVCGYMGLQLKNPLDDLGYRDDGYDQQEVNFVTKGMDVFFNVQRAQQFEYNFAHMIDKPFQSFFGYIHVLPGAFSGYRWSTLKSVPYKPSKPKAGNPAEPQRQRLIQSKGKDNQEGQVSLMKKYLKTAVPNSQKETLSLEDQNMYLAEDRIMCLGIHTLGYTLDYLPDAESVVDPVTSLTLLLGQRRRWINGSWFAFNYVRSHWNESPSFLFSLQLCYYIVMQVASWLQVSLFYVSMNLTLRYAIEYYIAPVIPEFPLSHQLCDYNKYKSLLLTARAFVSSVPDILSFVFICLIMANVLYSSLLNNNNARFKKLYYLSSTLLGIYGVATASLFAVNTANIIMQTEEGPGAQGFGIPFAYFRALVVFIIFGHLVPVLWTFSFNKYIEMLNSVLSYVYYFPTYLNFLQVFAFCRIDDLSWGTKGLDDNGSEGKKREWQKKKYIFVLKYLFSNIVAGYVLVKVTSFEYPRKLLILGSTCLIAVSLGLRLLFALAYLLNYYRMSLLKPFSKDYIWRNQLRGSYVLDQIQKIKNNFRQNEFERTRSKIQVEYRELVAAASLFLKTQLSKKYSIQDSEVTEAIDVLARELVNQQVIPKKQLLEQTQQAKLELQQNYVKNFKQIESLSGLPKIQQQLKLSRSESTKSVHFKRFASERPEKEAVLMNEKREQGQKKELSQIVSDNVNENPSDELSVGREGSKQEFEESGMSQTELTTHPSKLSQKAYFQDKSEEKQEITHSMRQITPLEKDEEREVQIQEVQKTKAEGKKKGKKQGREKKENQRRKQ